MHGTIAITILLELVFHVIVQNGRVTSEWNSMTKGGEHDFALFCPRAMKLLLLVKEAFLSTVS